MRDFLIVNVFLRLMMQRALWALSSHPLSPTVAWQHSLACQSKSSCCAPCQRGSKYVYVGIECIFKGTSIETLVFVDQIYFKCVIFFCFSSDWCPHHSRNSCLRGSRYKNHEETAGMMRYYIHVVNTGITGHCKWFEYFCD